MLIPKGCLPSCPSARATRTSRTAPGCASIAAGYWLAGSSSSGTSNPSGLGMPQSPRSRSLTLGSAITGWRPCARRAPSGSAASAVGGLVVVVVVCVEVSMQTDAMRKPQQLVSGGELRYYMWTYPQGATNDQPRGEVGHGGAESAPRDHRRRIDGSATVTGPENFRSRDLSRQCRGRKIYNPVGDRLTAVQNLHPRGTEPQIARSGQFATAVKQTRWK
jgi:hypothetical protein